LEGASGRDTAAPFAVDPRRNDIDHPAHRVGTIEGRHRPANDLDSLNDSRQEMRFGPAKAVGGHVPGHVLPPSIDENQGILRRQPAHADTQTAGFALRAADVDAFHVGKRFRQAAYPPFLQVLARENGDAGRGFVDRLLIARSRYDDRIQLYPLRAGRFTRYDRILCDGNRCHHEEADRWHGQSKDGETMVCHNFRK